MEEIFLVDSVWKQQENQAVQMGILVAGEKKGREIVWICGKKKAGKVA